MGVYPQLGQVDSDYRRLFSTLYDPVTPVYISVENSITLLGRYYSTLVEVQPDHKVIDSGPYRFIRHPNYLGQMVGAVGLGLALQSWVSLLVLLVIGGSFFAYRIRNEEAFLVAEMGGYADYMKRTKRLVPFIF